MNSNPERKRVAICLAIVAVIAVTLLGILPRPLHGSWRARPEFGKAELYFADGDVYFIPSPGKPYELIGCYQRTGRNAYVMSMNVPVQFIDGKLAGRYVRDMRVGWLSSGVVGSPNSQETFTRRFRLIHRSPHRPSRTSWSTPRHWTNDLATVSFSAAWEKDLPLRVLVTVRNMTTNTISVRDPVVCIEGPNKLNVSVFDSDGNFIDLGPPMCGSGPHACCTSRYMLAPQAKSDWLFHLDAGCTRLTNVASIVVKLCDYYAPERFTDRYWYGRASQGMLVEIPAISLGREGKNTPQTGRTRGSIVTPDAAPPEAHQP
ncbi:MAG: hypothetical protein ISS35_10325 [Kiritimatiellae bacterium]|nr:hypothetical protein [Kiritimatiellia bacterium]